MKQYVADFETTTTEENCHVWAYAICDIYDPDNVQIGTTLDQFMDWCISQDDNPKIFFHNLKFDGQFILSWLFAHGLKCIEDPADRETGTFSTLISDKGMYYQIEVNWHIQGKKVRKTIFQDSLKLIPLSVDAIAKSFKLDIMKLEIDYSAHNAQPEGAAILKEEAEYIRHDVQIVAHALRFFFDHGLDKMTIGSCAMAEYKKLITKKAFKRWFPPPKFDSDIRQSYRGGFTYLNPKFAGRIVGNGIVLDVNSLYPSVMYDSYLPFGTPIYFEGKYEEDEIYPLYTQMFRCQFEIKKGKLPTIQIKHSMFFKGNEYLTSSDDEEVVLCLNSVDMDLFLDHYDVYNLEYISGWKFKATKGLFVKYIDKWSGEKIKAKEEGNHGMYLIAKLFLNSLYGKFGTNPVFRSKIPFMAEDGSIKYRDADPEEREPIYIAMASFITSNARYKTISAAQKIMDDYAAGKSKIQFIYADTDSLHCVSDDFSIPEGLEISDTDLGAWKFESKFCKGKFLRQKCYIEMSTEDLKSDTPEYALKVTVAGMPKSCHDQVNFHNFRFGATYTGKLQPKNVPGGVILKSIDYTISR